MFNVVYHHLLMFLVVTIVLELGAYMPLTLCINLEVGKFLLLHHSLEVDHPIYQYLTLALILVQVVSDMGTLGIQLIYHHFSHRPLFISL